MTVKIYTDSKGAEFKRRFEKIGAKNSGDSNLTELYASEAESSGFTSHNDWRAHNNRYQYIAAESRKNKPTTFLDVGCGRGQQLNWIWKNRQPFPVDYWALDLRAKPTWLDEWKVKTDVTLVQMDVVKDDPTKLEGWHPTFDMIICTEVLEHIPRDWAPEFMQRMHDWTTPGGYCYLSTPNSGISDSFADNHADPTTGESREWSYADKIVLAQSAGYEVVKTYGTFARKDRILEADAENHWLDNPIVKAYREFAGHVEWSCVIASAYPEFSNNSLFKMRRPL